MIPSINLSNDTVFFIHFFFLFGSFGASFAVRVSFSYHLIVTKRSARTHVYTCMASQLVSQSDNVLSCVDSVRGRNAFDFAVWPYQFLLPAHSFAGLVGQATIRAYLNRIHTQIKANMHTSLGGSRFHIVLLVFLLIFLLSAPICNIGSDVPNAHFKTNICVRRGGTRIAHRDKYGECGRARANQKHSMKCERQKETQQRRNYIVLS